MKATDKRLATIKRYLDEGRVADLFVEELGWDRPPTPARTITVDGITAIEIADKRGVGVWRFDQIPSGRTIRVLDKEISKRTRERLLVFQDSDQQTWLWPEQRRSGSGFKLVKHTYVAGTTNQDLAQRLAAATFAIDEEPILTVIDVLDRVRVSFAADKVTKRFYSEYRKQHEQLVGLIEGIESLEDRSWYGSVLMTRLMFLYFIEKKGFLDNDPSYLRNRLAMVRKAWGTNAFYGFYRNFLLPLFHEGLGSHRHEYDHPEVAEIIGDVPYVNGGIFAPHLLETRYADIKVPDEAFEEVFSLFDQYRWHLDERPTDDVNEINPDVLGYIFEQYINQKEQGAYYTKEDVTGYMTGVTITPAFFDKLGADSEPWVLLTVDPDRYIYDSVRHGVDINLPDDIAEGLDDPAKRDDWANKAPAQWGLPGETWWEVVDRRRYCYELKQRLADGRVGDANDAVTYNLDLRTLAIDYLDTLGSIEEVTEAFYALTQLRILDPTSGSGAFLFAALETLADLYEILIDRARELDDGTPPPFLVEADRHPNVSYYILKTAILNNLYGVDVMEEAGEISRLRLFLKLVAQVDKRDDLEPLPDLDFNIRTGNLLVGIATPHDARTRLADNATLFNYQQIDEAAGVAETVAHVYRQFVNAQAADQDPDTIRSLKNQLNNQLAELREQLDSILYELRSETEGFDEWRSSHQPFHWFVEYPEVFIRGGFDVVVGNPPYIRRTKVRNYRWIGYRTQNCPDIYAMCMERAVGLSTRRGRFSMVVPHSVAYSKGFETARRVLREKSLHVWLSSYALMPDALFKGVRIRNSIVVTALDGLDGDHDSTVYSGWRNRWRADERPHLFPRLRYMRLPAELAASSWPFLGSEAFAKWIVQAKRSGYSFGKSLGRSGKPAQSLRYKTVAGYYVSMWPLDTLGDPPSYDPDGRQIPQTKVKTLFLGRPRERDIAFMLGIGKWFFAWWQATGDDFDVTQGVIKSFPLDPEQLREDVAQRMLAFLDELITTLRENVTYKGYKYQGRPGARIGNWYVPAARDITDKIDHVLVDALADDELWRDLNTMHARLTLTEESD